MSPGSPSQIPGTSEHRVPRRILRREDRRDEHVILLEELRQRQPRRRPVTGRVHLRLQQIRGLVVDARNLIEPSPQPRHEHRGDHADEHGDPPRIRGCASRRP